MKTFGRIIIILAVFALMMGVTYLVVNASGNSSNGIPQFEGREGPQFANGERPEFPGGGRPEGRERGGGGWMFGLIKNVGIIAIVTVLIAVPRSLIKNRKRAVPMATE
jgi:hypothetical protein